MNKKKFILIMMLVAVLAVLAAFGTFALLMKLRGN